MSDEDIPEFPGYENDEDIPEPIIFPGVEVVEEARPRPTIAQERQSALLHELGDLLYINRGDVSSVGGLLVRSNVEDILGEHISEDEYEYLADRISEYVGAIVRPTLALTLESLHRIYVDATDSED